MLFLNKKAISFLILFCSLIISFYLGENSSGGSKHDFLVTKKYLDIFQVDFYLGLQIFKEMGELHLPFFYILIANLSKLFGETSISFFYLIISSLIPLVLFSALQKKFPKANTKILFILSLTIFLSPYFRSSAVWLTTDNLALLFFLLSINSFLKINYFKNNIFRNSLYCFFFLILASYTRHYYSLFFLFYFLAIQSKLNLKENLLIIFFNLVCSIPVIIYLLYILQDKGLSNTFHFVGFDFIFNILTFTSLYLFYFLPFILNKNAFKHFKEKFLLKKMYFLIIFLLILLLLLIYDVPDFSYGGGVFYKISKLFNLKLFLFFSLLGSIFLYVFNEVNKKNILIYLILIVAFPLTTLFQKYYDPLIYILFLTLINSKFLNNIINKDKIKLNLIFGYYLIFLVGCNIYYTLKI